MTLSQITKKLISDPQSLTEEDVSNALNLILHDDNVHELQVAAFLSSARATGVDHTPAFIAAAVANLISAACKIENSPDNTEFLDIVGTGGDGQNTFNVSTTAAIVAAGTGVVKVAKHGGPASTSTSGASDLLTHLGVNLSNVNSKTTGKLLSESDFVYMSGPVFHPVLARVKHIRRNLGIPTVFNLVGPLLNPAPIRARVLGVYTPSLGITYAQAAQRLYPGKRALVVCGAEGLDEISPAGPTYVWEVLESGEISEYSVSPDADFGLSPHSLSEVASGTPSENASLLKDLLDNKLESGHPIRDYVLMNTAALLYISGTVSTFKEGIQLADKSIELGGAKKVINGFITAVERL